MPHKHTRREKDLSTFDLPPTVIAKSLPVTTISKKTAAADKKKNDASKDKAPVKRKRGKDANDAPRAFRRLMAFAGGKKTRDGLDDGNDRPTKKQKKAATESAKKEAEPVVKPKATKNEELTIKPGERMSEFARRVDAALPISGLVGKAKNGKDPLGLKTKRTKKERKMHKMYDEWREQDKKIQEAREEAEEEEEEKRLELEAMGVNWDAIAPGKKGKKGTKYFGMVGGKEEDPWEEIKRKRGEAKVGFNEVADAPPDLKILPKKKLLVSGATVDVDDIPKSAGSLRKREELQSVREDVVASYRRLMQERREAAAQEAAHETKRSKAKPSGKFRTAA